MLAASRQIVAALIGAAIGFVPAVAQPHAIVVAATPSAGAEVAPGDLDVRLEFNARVDHARSRLILQDAAGSQAPILFADSDPNVLAGHARITAPGRWTLRWQVLSIDGHITRGDVPFVVRAP